MSLRLELTSLDRWKFNRRRRILELSVIRAGDKLAIRRGWREFITLDDSELFQLVDKLLLVLVLLGVAVRVPGTKSRFW